MARRAAATTVAFLLLMQAAAAAQTGALEGRVTDAETGLPLAAANIVVEGTVLGTMSDREGRYRLPGVPAGRQRVVFSVMGYETAVREVGIEADATIRIDVALAPSPLALPDIVVTAGRQAQRAERAAAAVSVLTGEQLAARAAPRLDLVLPLVPGVTMVQDQLGIRGSTGYTRGAGGRVLVLMDGVPAIGGDTGNIRWDTLPAEVIERVEVVKGAASALYGSSAMGGVVNVLTRSALSGPVTSLRLRAGVWDLPYYDAYRFKGEGGLTRGGDLTVVRPIGALGLLASGGYEFTDGYRENGWSRYMHLLLKVEGPRGTRDRWNIVTTAARQETGNFFEWKSPNDPYEVSPLVRGDWLRSDKLMVTSFWRRLTGQASYLQLQPHLFANRWRNFFRDNEDEATVVRAALDAQLVTAMRIGTVTTGAMVAATGVEATIYGKHGVWEGALFAQNEAELGPRSRLTVGVRVDAHDTDVTGTRAVVSPRVALVVEPVAGVTLRLLGGRGFRAPSVAERFVSTTTSGFRVVPNLRLDPETAWSGEVGGSWRPLPLLWIESALFRSRFESMIEPALQADGNIQFRNLTRARLAGAELAVRGTLPSGRLRFGWSYLWLAAENLDSGEPLDYRRPKRGTATVELLGGRWTLAADWLYGATVDRVGVYPYDRRVPLRRLDARLAVEALGARWIVHGRNLTEYAYTEIERNLSPPREWVISVERSW